MNDDAFERIKPQKFAAGFGGNELSLNIATADVEKFWKPAFHAAGGFGELPPRKPAIGAAHRRALDRAVSIDNFRRCQPHRAAGGAAHANARHVRRVLPEIIHAGGGGEFARGDGLAHFDRPQWLGGDTLSAQRIVGANDRYCVGPVRVVETWLVPAAGFEPRIVIFTAVDAG